MDRKNYPPIIPTVGIINCFLAGNYYSTILGLKDYLIIFMLY